jgi:glycosyltransferase involved in cell wall biosynthesis
MIRMTDKPPINIALVATIADFGGAEKVILNIIDLHNQENFRIHLVVFWRSGLKDSRFLNELNSRDVETTIIFTDRSRIKYLNPILNLLQFFFLIRRNNTDLIHSNGYRANFLSLLPILIRRIPAIATCHGYVDNGRTLWLYNRLDRFFLRFMRRIIVVSNDLKNTLLKAGILEDKIVLIPNTPRRTLDSQKKTDRSLRSRHGISENDTVLGFVGRLSPEKGIHILLKALSLLNARGLNIKTIIIGDGPELEKLRRISREYGISGRVIFTGFLQSPETFMNQIDIFVLPSLTEGTPMALLEAMSQGLPVVASSVGQIPEIIRNGQNGLTVRPGFPEDLAEALEKVIENPDLRHRFSRESLATVQSQFSQSRWIDSVENTYRSALY